MEIKDIISSGLLELYVLGMATEQETAQVTAWIHQYPEIAAEVAAIESGMQHYANANAISPNAGLKEKVFAAINNTSTITGSPAKVIPIGSSWKYAAAAAIILLLGSLIFNFIYFNKYTEANKSYEAAVVEKNNALGQLASLEQTKNEMENNWKIVQSKYSQPVSLNGMEKTPDAAAKIFWMKNTGEVYIDPANLPEPPAGMQYQFWGIVDGKPVDGGMIVYTKNGKKYNIQKMKTFGKAEAFAVTLETEGGHTQPEGQMFVMGKM